jgi:hypothetical protein
MIRRQSAIPAREAVPGLNAKPNHRLKECAHPHLVGGQFAPPSPSAKVYRIQSKSAESGYRFGKRSRLSKNLERDAGSPESSRSSDHR